MSEQKERETKQCYNCKQTIYKFHSKRTNKDYWCNSNKYDDYHNCLKKGSEKSSGTAPNSGESKKSESVGNENIKRPEGSETPLNTEQTLFSILRGIGKLSTQIDELKTLIEKKCKE